MSVCGSPPNKTTTMKKLLISLLFSIDILSQPFQWTWVGGDGNIMDTSGVYGQLGVPSRLNSPCGREGSSINLNPLNNELVMFGGAGWTDTLNTGTQLCVISHSRISRRFMDFQL